jgi:glucosyl-3-phosphoglycerate synthase
MQRHEEFLTSGKTISVCFPAVDEESTIGAALAPLIKMREDGYIHQVVVVDESTDWTADIAASQGAEVHRQSTLMPSMGPVLGKGDAMWRALSVLTGDIVLFLDADSRSIQRHYVFAMCEPILKGDADFVKGYYKRPLGGDPDGGGRLNHLFGRPIMRAYFPELAWLEQPLAGETAMTRELAVHLPFESRWAIEPALTIDAFLAVGVSRMAQANLGVHEHRHWPLRDLAKRCDEVLETVLERARQEDRQPQLGGATEKRPPLAWALERAGAAAGS